MTRAFKTTILAAACAAMSATAGLAGSTGGSCSDASGSFAYEGGKLYLKDEPGRAIEHEVTSSFLVLDTLDVCVNAEGRRFRSGKTVHLSYVDVQLNPDHAFEMVLVCEVAFDDYPNMAGVDTTCVEEVQEQNRRLPEAVPADPGAATSVR